MKTRLLLIVSLFPYFTSFLNAQEPIELHCPIDNFIYYEEYCVDSPDGYPVPYDEFINAGGYAYSSCGINVTSLTLLMVYTEVDYENWKFIRFSDF